MGIEHVHITVLYKYTWHNSEKNTLTPVANTSRSEIIKLWQSANNK